MGFENRDYARDGSYTRFASGEALLANAPVCKWLILVTIGVYLLQIFAMQRVAPEFGDAFTSNQEQTAGLFTESQVPVAERWLILDTDKVVYQGQIWRLLTCAFCHSRSDLWHIAINLLLLYWFGRTLETLYGSKEFLLFYLTAALVASMTYCAVQLIVGERVPALGASGAVMGVMCVYTMWYPRDKINFMMIIPIEMRFLLIIYLAYDLHPLLLQLAGTPQRTGVGHAAHLGGFAFGFLYWRQSWRLEKFWNRVESPLRPLFGGRSSVTRTEPPKRFANSTTPNDADAGQPVVSSSVEQRLDSELDLILEKISQQGQESLTARERSILDQVSRKYRER